MVKDYKQIIKKYFDNNGFIEASINSFDYFIDYELQEIVEEVGEIRPTITPEGVEDFVIKVNKIWIGEPELIEADGSRRIVYPMESRLRKLTYAAPLFLEVSAHVDGLQVENFTTQIGKIPIMIKSKHCNLNKLKREELIEKGEDPDDMGGYFILNGNERVLVMVEDLASNRLFTEKTSIGPSPYKMRVFSEEGALRIPHTLEQMKDGVMYMSFTRFKRVPIMAIIKALGLIRDRDITAMINTNKDYEDIFINLYKTIDLKNQEDALDYLGRQMGITQGREIKIERAREFLDRYLLPHLGISEEDRITKAYNLCKMIKRFLMVAKDGYSQTDKDHYLNKRVKLSGDLLASLFRVNIRVLVNDMLYNFQRLVKRGKFSSIKIIIRDKLLTGRINSAMATGSWPGGRQGVSQNIDRTNFLGTMSHLNRVVSLLSSSQENFEARALHGTHWGKLCPIETPEGTPIGLRKNLAMLCKISHGKMEKDKIVKALADLGVEKAKND
jgi:DNA-directed RNA polymerase beta subunit|tara:strand:- start:9868 stop:11364 length:1497 start_codon:yes stop_codon:yes gene_type:complete